MSASQTGLLEVDALDDEACWELADRLLALLRDAHVSDRTTASVVWLGRELLRNSERYGGHGGPAVIVFEDPNTVHLTLPGPNFDSVYAGTCGAGTLGLANSVLARIGARWVYTWTGQNIISIQFNHG